MKSTTGKKWLKLKEGLRRVLDAAKEDIPFMETAEIRKVAGLGVHLTEVYPMGRCYLKGFFNALEAWR